jgi:hypothetical protein
VAPTVSQLALPWERQLRQGPDTKNAARGSFSAAGNRNSSLLGSVHTRRPHIPPRQISPSISTQIVTRVILK